MAKWTVTQAMAARFVDHWDTLSDWDTSYRAADCTRQWLRKHEDCRAYDAVRKLVFTLEQGSAKQVLIAETIKRSALDEWGREVTQRRELEQAIGVIVRQFAPQLVEAIDWVKEED